jgi:hypothetical protein
MNSAPANPQSAIRNPHLERASLMRAIVSPSSRPLRSSVESDRGPAGQAPQQIDMSIITPHPLLKVSDLAEEWSYDETHILNLIDEGIVFAFFINAEETPKHFHYRIPREAAVKGSRLTLAGMQQLIDTTADWLFPVERFGRRQNLSVRDCESALLVSQRHVRELYEAGALGAQNLGAAQQLSLRIPRPELTAFVQRRLKLTNNL